MTVLHDLLTAPAAATPATSSEGFVFTTRGGTRLSRDAVAVRLTAHARTAAASCPHHSRLAFKRACSLAKLV